eukprot:gene1626-1770_t
MDIYLKTPGSSLTGSDKVLFDNINAAIENSTHDMLIRPDWEANMRCVDLISSARCREVFSEVVFLLRRKLRANQPKVVVLTLRLMEALVNNCGSAWHEAMNDEKLMYELGGVARKYVAKLGGDSREVTDVCLDLIQGWGEAFLPKRKLYPNIVELYFQLRREGLPFRVANQFDPSRVPIFNKPVSNEEDYLDPQTDAMLAAAIQQSLEVESRSTPSRGNGGSGGGSHNGSHGPSPLPGSGAYGTRPAPVDTNSSQPRQLMEALQASLPLLRDLIYAAVSEQELRHNDFAVDVVEQIKSHLRGVNTAIEQAMSDPPVLEKLFALNDDAQLLINVFNDVLNGDATIGQAKSTIGSRLGNLGATSNGPSGIVPPPVERSSPLLDLNHSVASSPGGRNSPIAAMVNTAPRMNVGSPGGRNSPIAAAVNYNTAPRMNVGPPPSRPMVAVPILAPPPAAPRSPLPYQQPPLYAQNPNQPPFQPQPMIPPVVPVVQRPAPPRPAVLKKVDSDCGDVIVQAEDPFAPEALDALFDSKPAKGSSQNDNDPFSTETSNSRPNPSAVPPAYPGYPQYPQGYPQQPPMPVGGYYPHPSHMPMPPNGYPMPPYSGAPYQGGYPQQMLPPNAAYYPNPPQVGSAVHGSPYLQHLAPPQQSNSRSASPSQSHNANQYYQQQQQQQQQQASNPFDIFG